VETDIRRTRDGRLVLIHDKTLDRTSDGSGRVCDCTLDEIQRLDAGGWFGTSFAGERILTFSEGLELLQSLELGVVFEIKEEDTCLDAVKTIRDLGFVARSHAVSFLPGAIRTVLESEPELTGSVIFRPRAEVFRGEDSAAGIIDIARQARAHGVALFDTDATPAIVAAVREAGLLLSVLLINTDDQIRRVLPFDPVAILTDYPDRVRRATAARGKGEERC
jgi:glycerophosphoryl diester phosphodiesterase